VDGSGTFTSRTPAINGSGRSAQAALSRRSQFSLGALGLATERGRGAFRVRRRVSGVRVRERLCCGTPTGTIRKGFPFAPTPTSMVTARPTSCGDAPRTALSHVAMNGTSMSLSLLADPPDRCGNRGSMGTAEEHSPVATRLGRLCRHVADERHQLGPRGALYWSTQAGPSWEPGLSTVMARRLCGDALGRRCALADERPAA